MTLKKAIELGKDAEKSLKFAGHYDHSYAILLLIEAGKRELESRGALRPSLYPLLPGETQE